MADLNKVFLMGNITRDPEVRHIPSGQAVLEMSLAINRRYKGNDGEFKEEVAFVPVTVWGRQAETCAEYLRKGSPLFVEGRLKLDQWEKDGEKRSRLMVTAERTQFIGSPRKSGEIGDAPRDVGPPPDAPSPGGDRGSTGDGKDEDLPF
jgi:single-strand DNA-binding protein